MNTVLRNTFFYLALMIGAFACQSIIAMDQSDAHEELFATLSFEEQCKFYQASLRKYNANLKFYTALLNLHQDCVTQYELAFDKIDKKVLKFNKAVDAFAQRQIQLNRDIEASRRSNGACKSVHLIEQEDENLKKLEIKYKAKEAILNEETKRLSDLRKKIEYETKRLTECANAIIKAKNFLDKTRANLLSAELYPQDADTFNDTDTDSDEETPLSPAPIAASNINLEDID